MSLALNVFPGVENALSSLVPDSLAGVSVGEQLAIPESPWAWILLSSFNGPDLQATDLERTEWMVEVRLMAQYAADQRAAELTLAGLIEPVRQCFRRHIRLGQGPPQTVVFARVGGGSTGYISVNGIIHRFYSLRVAVSEKVQVSYAA